jgi:hypothetical protein
LSKFSAAIVPIVSIGVGVVLLSVAYAATNTDSAAPSPGPNPPALEKNERQMERATKVRVAEQKQAAKTEWAHLARVKAEKARKAELARQEAIARQAEIDREAALQAEIDRINGDAALQEAIDQEVARQKAGNLTPIERCWELWNQGQNPAWCIPLED